MIRALVPVNLRPLEKAYKLGNQFGLVFLDLPIGIENPVERLYAVRAQHERAEGQLPAGARARACSRRWARDRSVLQEVLLQALARNATAVMTNVPGPAAAALHRRRDDRQPHVLGAAVGRHRHGRVDPVVRRRRCSSGSSPTAGCVPIPKRVIERFGARVREARADDADGAVAARRRSRSPTGGERGSHRRPDAMQGRSNACRGRLDVRA